ncbi:hypothetical protein CDL12_02420 [Handroanthus impetiginosus]|nr:hypothetical protein CDL12_02420 [Handroanthus impetiginosus]
MAFHLVENKSSVVQIALKALELLLLSAGLISTLLMVRGAVIMPYSCELVFSGLVGFWNSMRCLLSSSLYICIIINFMVVSIALSSTFQSHQMDNHNYDFKVVNVDDEHDVLIAESPVEAETLGSRTETCSRAIATSTLYRGSGHDDSTHSLPDIAEQDCIQHGAHEIKKTAYSLYFSQDLSDYTEEEIVKTKGKGLLLEMESDKEHEEEDDTMEATWKAITGGGKQRPKSKQLRKSETLNVQVPLPPPTTAAAVQNELVPSTPSWKEVRKSETFNNTVSLTCRGGLRRDPSISLDEFNNQVEAFIKKFNDNMRLQRQESDQKFLDMMNQGL